MLLVWTGLLLFIIFHYFFFIMLALNYIKIYIFQTFHIIFKAFNKCFLNVINIYTHIFFFAVESVNVASTICLLNYYLRFFVQTAHLKWMWCRYPSEVGLMNIYYLVLTLSVNWLFSHVLYLSNIHRASPWYYS